MIELESSRRRIKEERMPETTGQKGKRGTLFIEVESYMLEGLLWVSVTVGLCVSQLAQKTGEHENMLPYD